jgi:enoyl-CoA hydratase/carnithine racemase
VGSEVSIEYGADDVLGIVFRRPDAGNVLTPEIGDAVSAALAGLKETTKAVFLSAEGADFCIGRKTALPPPDARVTASDLRRLIADPVLDFYTALRSIPVPLVVAVRGRAFGVGCALVGLADIAIADDEAQFAVPEMARDIPPTLVMTALADRIPHAAMARLILTRDPISAAEAKAIGLVALTAGAADLDQEVARVRTMLAGNSVPVLRAIKGYLTNGMEMSYAARRDYAAFANATAFSARFR